MHCTKAFGGRAPPEPLEELTVGSIDPVTRLRGKRRERKGGERRGKERMEEEGRGKKKNGREGR